MAKGCAATAAESSSGSCLTATVARAALLPACSGVGGSGDVDVDAWWAPAGPGSSSAVGSMVSGAWAEVDAAVPAMFGWEVGVETDAEACMPRQLCRAKAKPG